MFSEKIVMRFWTYVNKKRIDKCWEWNKGKSGGYGIFYPKNKSYGAHRYSYELHYGKIPRKFMICHHCDNPPCVNPEHLFLGTAADNVRDMHAKGRRKYEKISAESRLKISKSLKQTLSDPKHKLRLRNNWLGENNPKYKPKVKLQCAVCKLTFFEKPSHSNTRRFCSVICFNLVRTFVLRRKKIS